MWRHRAWEPDAATSLSTWLREPPAPLPSASDAVLAGQLDAARAIIPAIEGRPPESPDDPAISDDLERIRWFPLPGEALTRVHSHG
jgi:hypothetical protein